MPKPVRGGTVWTQDGIEPARAYWNEEEAFREYMIELVRKIPDKDLQLEFMEILNKQGVAHRRLRDALHVIEIIGITAKQDRLNNGDT